MSCIAGGFGSCIFDWTVARQVRLNPGKYEALNIFDCSINGRAIQWKPFVRYLGIHVNSKLTWSDHCTKATKLLNVLRRTVWLLNSDQRCGI